ncbi:MAG TPA: hypothetical protein VHU84_01605 [Lacipirellulaceae bacterium]|jgi:Tfp pilus assembly pilus retraction ATPase PilT|nr:hypothetical protein [Lacipirellulaceae bacterium]
MKFGLVLGTMLLAVGSFCSAVNARGKDIDSLKLSPKAKKAAEQLLKEYPDIVFTSGRRDLAEQASAMAANVVETRDYIKNTYSSNDASKACQKWVDDHPEAKTRKEIATGLLKTLKELGPKAGQISKHLTGDAFDVQPVKENADEVKKSIRELPGVQKFLEKEAGLERWHVQF